MKCPACQRSILTRRSGVCSFCGVPLPSELRLTPEQLQAIEAEERELARRRKQREEREERERKEARDRDVGTWDGGY